MSLLDEILYLSIILSFLNIILYFKFSYSKFEYTENIKILFLEFGQFELQNS